MPGKFSASTMAVAVIAALLIGFAASTFAYRFRWLHVPGEPVVERLDRELHLSPEQRERIVGIMRDTRFKTMQLQQEFRSQRREAFGQAFAQIRATLTPDQQAKFDREFAPFGERHGWQRGGHDFGGPPPGAPPPPPPPSQSGNGGL